MLVLFVIESGIPCPDPAWGRPKLYPWDQMQPNDSILIGLDRINSARSSLRHYQKKHPERAFMTRLDDETSCVRIWRLK